MKIQPADYYKNKEIKSESPRNMGYPDHPRGQAQKKPSPTRPPKHIIERYHQKAWQDQRPEVYLTTA